MTWTNLKAPKCNIATSSETFLHTIGLPTVSDVILANG